MACPSGLAKHILYIVNVLLVVFGTVLIAVGVVGVVSASGGSYNIVLGVKMFILAFFGCWGDFKEKRWILTTYAYTLIVLCVLYVLFGALLLVSLNDDTNMTKTARDKVEKDFQNYVNDQNNTDKKKDVDDLQQEFKCCGVDNPDYWTTAIGKIPDSCFKDNNRSSTQYTEGCVSSFKNFTYSQLKTRGGVLLGTAVFELFAAIFVFILRNRLGDQHE